jgi:hypothetical protein
MAKGHPLVSNLRPHNKSRMNSFDDWVEHGVPKLVDSSGRNFSGSTPAEEDEEEVEHNFQN